LGALTLAVVVALAGLLVPTPSGAGDPTATVAAVQGNVPRTGLDALGQKLQVTRNHVAETQRLAADIAAGRVPAPDLVLWPENSSDLDPFVSPTAADLLSSASRSVGRPILVGAVLQGPGTHQVRNAGLVWGPNGYQGPIYVKQHPVPFGEYLPGRAILERLVGRFADDLPSDFVPGHSTGVLPIAGPAGTYRLGDVICFEVAYDHLVRQPVRDGAQLLVVQTNNATFGRSGETYQQLAMSRLRAVEHGRSVVVVATSGVSALIAPDGRIVRRTAVYTPDVLVAALPLSSRQTIADRLGASVEWLLVGLAVSALLAGAVSGRRTSFRRWVPARRTRRGGRAT
jgi:apolipoprotein N-acyltransferase